MLSTARQSSRAHIIAAAILGFSAQALSAQQPAPRPVAPPDSTHLVAMMANSMRMLKPAQFVLDHRVELLLSQEQVSHLEALAAAQKDSAVARQERQMSAAAKRTPGFADAMSWSGPLDEKAIRDHACEQGAQQAEAILNLARDRHAVGAILTTNQLAEMPRVEAGEMMKALKGP